MDKKINIFDSNIDLKKVQASEEPCDMIAVGSGKGGAGKTIISLNLAYQYAQSNYKTLLIDSNFEFGNLNILLNKKTQKTSEQVASGEVHILNAIESSEYGFDFLSCNNEGNQFPDFTQSTMNQFVSQIKKIRSWYDVIIVDTPSVLSSDSLKINLAANTQLVILTPEPSSITDSYAYLKLLHLKMGLDNIGVLVNQAQDANSSFKIYQRFAEVARNFLNIPIDYVGFILTDQELKKNILRRQIFNKNNPTSLLDLCFVNVRNELVKKKKSKPTTHTVENS